MADAKIVHVDPSIIGGVDMVVELCEAKRGCAYVTFNGRRIHVDSGRLREMADALLWPTEKPS